MTWKEESDEFKGAISQFNEQIYYCHITQMQQRDLFSLIKDLSFYTVS